MLNVKERDKPYKGKEKCPKCGSNNNIVRYTKSGNYEYLRIICAQCWYEWVRAPLS